MKDFVVKNGSYCFKSTREKLYSKLSEIGNLRKIVELLHIFITSPDEVERYAKIMQSHSSDKCVHSYKIEILNLFEL